MAGQTHGHRLCNSAQRGLEYALPWIQHCGQDLCAVLHPRPVSVLPLGAWAVMRQGVLPSTAVPGVAFPPLSCSLLTFANSPVTKGCAGSQLTTSCGICAGVPSPGLQASSFLFLPAARMCTASKKQRKGAFSETQACHCISTVFKLSLPGITVSDGTSEV